MNRFLLGIDYGTGGCKVTVIDETGAFVGEASTEFVTYHDHPGWSEQEPSGWWTALCASLKKLAEKGVDLQRVAALALDGSTHNAVLLGRGAFHGNAPTGDCAASDSSRGCSSANCTSVSYRPVRRTIMWTDQRATAECEALKAGWGEKIFSTCYQMPAPTWTLPQLMWLKANEPEVLKKVERVLFVKDYVRYLLTGDAATDYIEAQGTLMFDMGAVRAFHGNAPTGDGRTGCAFHGNAPTGDGRTGCAFHGNAPTGASGAAASRGCSSVNCTDVSQSGCSSVNCTAGWDRELVELAGLKLSAMPRIVKPTDVVGKVTAQAAAETGLPEGVPVVCGTSDSAVEDYGAGAVEPGDLIIKLATAGNVNSMTSEAHPHPKTLTYSHVVPGMWYSVSATNAAALCMRWMRDAFYEIKSPSALSVKSPSALSVKSPSALSVKSPSALSAKLRSEATLNDLKRSDLTEPSLYALMDAEASASPVGANGVFFHPYLQGERCPYWDADLRASFTGVSISSTRGDFCRALMEGVAFSLRDCYRTLEEMKLPVKRIFLIGGGARSKLWSEIVANVFNVAVAVPSPADASFGSCLLAGVGTGVFPDVKSAVAKCLRIDRTIEPDPVAAAKYELLFACYRKIHDALEPIYRQRA